MTPDIKARRAWMAELESDLSRVASALPHQARRLLALQAALESGYGTATASKAHNLWNLTAGSDGSQTLRRYLDAGGRVLREENADWEYAKPGAPLVGQGWQKDGKGRLRKRIAQNWRSYATRDAAILDYAQQWMHRRDYGDVLSALLAGDVARWCYELHRVGFFTLPPEEYLSRMRLVEAEVSRSSP